MPCTLISTLNMPFCRGIGHHLQRWPLSYKCFFAGNCSQYYAFYCGLSWITIDNYFMSTHHYFPIYQMDDYTFTFIHSMNSFLVQEGEFTICYQIRFLWIYNIQITCGLSKVEHRIRPRVFHLGSLLN